MVESVGHGIQNLFGSDKPPKAIYNRYAAKTAKNVGTLGADLTGDVNQLAKNAFNTYMAGQGKQEALAGQQEGVLNTLMGRRLGADPNQLLQQIGNTAFGFINPNVVNPLSQFDVNSNRLMRAARGLNPAAVDSTAERLRNAQIASGRYLDTARQAYGALPGLYNSAYGQGVTNDQLAAGYIPQIAGTYNAVSERPSAGLQNRIDTVNSTMDAAGKGIQNILNATQGYKTPQNFADKLGKTGIQTGQQMQQDEAQMMSMISSVMGSMEGGASGMGGGEGGGDVGQGGASGPKFGSTYGGPGGSTFMSTPNAQGGGFSQRIG
jgi:hypothetical protein